MRYTTRLRFARGTVALAGLATLKKDAKRLDTEKTISGDLQTLHGVLHQHASPAGRGQRAAVGEKARLLTDGKTVAWAS